MIISLLQHATGDYKSEHNAKASVLRDEMITHFRSLPKPKKINLGQMLYSDDDAFVWLLNEINAKYHTNMKPIIISSIEGGKPMIEPSLDIGNDPVLLWQKGAHYEALYTSNDS